MTDKETLAEAIRLGGWLLADQALTAASGKTLMPLIACARDGSASPQLLAPRTKSELYDHQVIAGRALIQDMGSQVRHWAMVYSQDLEDSGGALIVEVGAGGQAQVITFAQRYTCGEEADLKLTGDLDLVGRELLPSMVQELLESLAWEALLIEGATRHDQAGQRWRVWYAARDHEQARVRSGEFSFAVPEGWFFLRTEDGKGWVITGLLPWEYRNFEPTIITMLVSYPDQATPEDAMESQRSQLLGQGVEVLKAEVARLPSPSLSSEAAHLAWNGEEEGHSFRTERVWVPTDVPSRFLLVCVTSFNEESWEGVRRAFEAVLTSLALAGKEEDAGPRRDDGHGTPWLKKLLRWRP